MWRVLVIERGFDQLSYSLYMTTLAQYIFGFCICICSRL